MMLNVLRDNTLRAAAAGMCEEVAPISPKGTRQNLKETGDSFLPLLLQFGGTGTGTAHHSGKIMVGISPRTLKLTT